MSDRLKVKIIEKGDFNVEKVEAETLGDFLDYLNESYEKQTDPNFKNKPRFTFYEE